MNKNATGITTHNTIQNSLPNEAMLLKKLLNQMTFVWVTIGKRYLQLRKEKSISNILIDARKLNSLFKSFFLQSVKNKYQQSVKKKEQRSSEMFLIKSLLRNTELHNY